MIGAINRYIADMCYLKLTMHNKYEQWKNLFILKIVMS